jgi:hypothetical protein
VSGEKDIRDLMGQGSLGTPRARQIITIGHNTGKLGDSDLMELCLDGLGTYVGNWRESLGDDVERYIKIEEREDEAGYLELEVRFTHNLNRAGADQRFRVQLAITELEP